MHGAHLNSCDTITEYRRLGQMKRLLPVLGLILLFSVYAHAQSAPPSVGELSYRLISPTFLGGGLHLTRTSTPQGVLVNPAAAAGFQRIILDANYTYMHAFGSAASGSGNAANLAMSIPTRIGVVSWGLGFQETLDFAGTAMDMGISGRVHAAFSKEIYSDIWFGFGMDGDFGKLDDVMQGGAALNLGFLHYPDRLWGLKNFSWGITLTGLGYRYGSTSRGYLNAIPGNITPAVGLGFDIIDSDAFTWTFRTDARVPSFTDFWFGVSSDLQFGHWGTMSISSSIDIRDAFEGSWQTVIPSAAIGVNIPLGGGKEDGDTNLQSTEMDIQVAAAPLYADVWAFSGGITLPLGVRDINPPDIAVEFDPPRYISPNYDGIQDELTFPYTASDERYITAYRWEIKDESGAIIRSFENKDERPENESIKNLGSRLFAAKQGTPLPEEFRWDGVTDSGSVAADGQYTVWLNFSDDNDNSATAGPFSVVVDTLAPELTLVVPEGLDLIFSPDGDGYKELFPVEQDGSVEHLWESAFSDAAGAEVKNYALAEASPASFDWDGRNDSGEIVFDGVYRYEIASTDKAGNSVTGAIENIIIDTRQPEVGLTINRSIFSPAGNSAISSLTMTPDIPVKSGIVDWSLDILDSSGISVKNWSRRESPAVPDFIEFDGRDDSGRRLDEGTYSGRLQIIYSNGFRPEVESPVFMVDVTPPSAQTDVDWDVFAPQGDSRRSRVTISQETSSEESWIGTLYSGDDAVNQWTWMQAAPDTLIWDGRDGEGRLVPDGTYTYVLSSTDRAGNTGASSPIRITVDTSAVEASVTASLDIFGPTGNGIKDDVSFFMNAKTESPIADWSLTVLNQSGQTFRSWSGTGTPPDSVVWNGRDDSGTIVPDRAYTASLRVTYEKGLVATAGTGEVIVDTEVPVISIEIRDRLFSPDNDESKDTLPVIQSSSVEEFFEGSFVDSSGRPVRSYLWTGSLENFEWDGNDDSGNGLPDGDYSFAVAGTDAAGNRSDARVSGIRIDTAPTPVYLTAAEGYIKAGERDPARMQSFTAVVPNDSGVAAWTFSIRGEDGLIAVTENGNGEVPSSFAWNGTDEQGRPVEGIFVGVLTVRYDKGSEPTAESRPFVSDGSAPEVLVSLEPQPFTPDGDNVDDEVVIGLTVEDRSRISEWSLVINDPRGKEFISFAGRGRPSERIIWDGRSGRGELVESAEDYAYTLTVTDVLGHTSVTEGEIGVGILVIRDGDRLKILINNITFQPSSPSLTVAGDEGAKNRQVLDRLAEIMKKFGSYRIVVEGHAVSLNWADAAAARREQDSILVPLSRSRAQTVVDELAARGIPASRLTAEGLGGAQPIVPHGDLEERWRNRRVEFYLEK